MNLLSARKQAVGDDAAAAVSALYAQHALGLTRLAHVMLDDRAAAEDVVQDAFCGLYRHWSNLTDPAKAQAYLRSAVLNGSRACCGAPATDRSSTCKNPAMPPTLPTPRPTRAACRPGPRVGSGRAPPTARPAARGPGPALLPRSPGQRDRRGHVRRRVHRPVHGAPGTRQPRAHPQQGAVMTGVEDLLRSATRDKATEVTPESIRPLDVAALRGARARSRRQLPPQFARWPRLAVPLAAAVAVVAVVALSIALPRLLTAGAMGRRRWPAGSRVPRGEPRDPAVLRRSNRRRFLPGTPSGRHHRPVHDERRTARDRQRARPVRHVQPGRPRAQHGTFVVGAQRWQSPGLNSVAALTVTLMLLHFDPATRLASFSPLPVPTLYRGSLQSVALSPDGAQLAVGVQASPAVLDLDVYSLSGGAVRTWSLRGAAAAQWSIDSSDNGEGGGVTNPNAMSWLPDGHTLAFDLSESRRDQDPRGNGQGTRRRRSRRRAAGRQPGGVHA